jgi:hypothetical protein
LPLLHPSQQRTRPQTIGYSLTDSPAGLAAWITEKIRAWTDPHSEIANDAMLDNLMLYWLPRSGASAARLYWESLSDVTRWLEGPLTERDLVHAPTGCIVFPYELHRPSREDAEQRFTNIRYWSEPQRGSHFAAWEQPTLFTAEVEAFSPSSPDTLSAEPNLAVAGDLLQRRKQPRHDLRVQRRAIHHRQPLNEKGRLVRSLSVKALLQSRGCVSTTTVVRVIKLPQLWHPTPDPSSMFQVKDRDSITSRALDRDKTRVPRRRR